MPFWFKEELLHHLWKFQLFDSTALNTRSGKPLQILQQGILQTNSGPDFLHSKIVVNNIILAGNVELHVNEAEWYQHKHQLDAAYNTVILHVVWESRTNYTNLENGQQVEVLELKHRVPSNLLERYEALKNSTLAIPCQRLYATTEPLLVSSFLQKLCVERLERKVNDIQHLLVACNNNWSQVLWIYLARYFGSGINNDVFQQWATTIPIAVIQKHIDQPLLVEAILFGQAGLLNETQMSHYPQLLFREYKYLKRLHRLNSLPAAVWKMAKLRPASFPNIRIAQLAALLCNGNWSIEALTVLQSFQAFKAQFKVVVNPYWNVHYGFDSVRVNPTELNIGVNTLQSLYINFLIPILFAYGRSIADDKLCEQALSMLDEVPFEYNKVTNAFAFLHLNQTFASDSQALIELKSNYCEKGRCLNCVIGNIILKGKK